MGDDVDKLKYRHACMCMDYDINIANETWSVKGKMISRAGMFALQEFEYGTPEWEFTWEML